MHMCVSWPVGNIIVKLADGPDGKVGLGNS